MILTTIFLLLLVFLFGVPNLVGSFITYLANNLKNAVVANLGGNLEIFQTGDLQI